MKRDSFLYFVFPGFRASGGRLSSFDRGMAAAVLWPVLAMAAVAQNVPSAPVPGATPGDPAAVGAEVAGEEPGGLLDPARPDQLKRYSLDRYEKIIEKSPFAFKIVRQEGPPPVSFAADLALAGFTVDAGKGIKYASLVDKKTNKRFVIRTDRPNEDGIQLVDLNRGQTLLESAVLARKGTEEAEIKADKQIIERKAVVNAAVAGPAAGVVRPGPQGNTANLVPNAAGGGRAANVQAQINAQLQAQPGQPGQPAGLPPGAVPAGQPAGAAGQAVAPQAPGVRPGQAPGRRRVILPPAVQN